MKIPYPKTKAHQRYKLADGTVVPGGSTVSKIGDDPGALIHWAWQLGCDGLDYKKVRDNAADIGSLAHFMVECYLGENEPDLYEFSAADIVRAKVCYDKFLAFWNDEGMSVIGAEVQLVSTTWAFGGTLDLVAMDRNGKLVLVDWKTSSGIYRSHISQVAGYEHLWNFADISMTRGKSIARENNPYSSNIERRAIVRIGKKEDGDFEIRWLDKVTMDRHFELFKAQLALYQKAKGLGK